ncbi:MAG: M56 family metallopeptidase [Lachnospiraceae bacterium]|nr:M56 family metallopeptidase [Lachnospiraceae bacterium]
MTEVMISSSVLILILCLFRYAFKGRVSSKVLYAMWGLAALRLLLPFSILGIVFAPDGASSGSGALLPASPYSVLSLAAGVKEQAIDGTVLQPLAENVTKGYVYTAPETDSLLVKLTSVDWEPVILVIWAAGTVLLFGIMLRSYCRFAGQLRANRRLLLPEDSGKFRYPVYVAENLKSPCLFSIGGKPAIYVTKETAQDPDMLLHVRVHEEVHGRHHDLVWSALRTGLLCFYWINPLVWLAAALSKRDCELACDEGAIELLGEEERFAYGRTLVSMIGRRKSPADILDSATTMTGSSRNMKERIRILAGQKKRTALALILLVVLVMTAVWFTFSGKESRKEAAADTLESLSVQAKAWTPDQNPEADGQQYSVISSPLKEAPSAEISINGELLVPNDNYYLFFDGKEFPADCEELYRTFLSVQAYREAENGDVIRIQLDPEALGEVTVQEARVYDYWIDKEGIIKIWNRFEYMPLEDVTVEPSGISFVMPMNMAQALSSTYESDGYFRGMEAECDLSDGSTVVYYFVLHSDSAGGE